MGFAPRGRPTAFFSIFNVLFCIGDRKSPSFAFLGLLWIEREEWHRVVAREASIENSLHEITGLAHDLAEKKVVSDQQQLSENTESATPKATSDGHWRFSTI